MGKQKSITQNRKVKHMLFLCIGIMVFATDFDILPISEENSSSFDKFYDKLVDSFTDAFENKEKLKNHVDAMRFQFDTFIKCKATISEYLEKHKNFYSKNPKRSEDFDKNIEEKIKQFLELTPKLPFHQDAVPMGKISGQKGAFGIIIPTENHDNIVVKKLRKKGEYNVETNLDDIQREVAFATMFYFQSPELAPIVYGYTEDEKFYYIYMEKFDMDLFEYYKDLQSKFKGVSQQNISRRFIKVLSQSIEFAEDLKKALKEAGITHNDIRNENILINVNEDGSLKFVICDFGMATFTGLYSPTHRQILLNDDGNLPHKDFDHRLIINPFQKLAYVFGVKMNNDADKNSELYAAIINCITNNDEYSLGISLYEIYLVHKMYPKLCQHFKNDQKEQQEFIEYARQQIDTLKKSYEFKKFLSGYSGKNPDYFGEDARNRYLEFIKKGLNAFKVFYALDALNDSLSTDDEEKKQYIEANKKVREYINSHVVDLWQNFEETYENQVLAFERN